MQNVNLRNLQGIKIIHTDIANHADGKSKIKKIKKNLGNF